MSGLTFPLSFLKSGGIPSNAPSGSFSPYILGKTAIPFIGLSSGSVAAGGGISAITALPVIYASAYCWFPANKLAGSIAAGWYYCTFSSTTAGTAFLNTYTSGVPTIPASPTAVTAGQGAFTGDTTEEFGPTFTVPANALGANGGLRVTWINRYTNSAGTKTLQLRYSGNAGTIYTTIAPTTTTTLSLQQEIWNRGATNSQVSNLPSAAVDYFLAGTGALITSAVDTTAATSIVLSGTRNTATDNIIMERVLVELISDGT